MTTTEIQLVVSVATILCSGVISAIVAHKLSSGRAEREFNRKKLEELYIAVHRYCAKLFTANMVWSEVMRGKIDYNQGLELFIKSHGEKDESQQTAMMIINIYFPQLRPSFDVILQQRDRINGIHSDFKAAYLRGEPCGSFVQPFLQELKGIDDGEKKLMEELFRISKSLK